MEESQEPPAPCSILGEFFFKLVDSQNGAQKQKIPALDSWIEVSEQIRT